MRFRSSSRNFGPRSLSSQALTPLGPFTVAEVRANSKETRAQAIHRQGNRGKGHGLGVDERGGYVTVFLVFSIYYLLCLQPCFQPAAAQCECDQYVHMHKRAGPGYYTVWLQNVHFVVKKMRMECKINYLNYLASYQHSFHHLLRATVKLKRPKLYWVAVLPNTLPH